MLIGFACVTSLDQQIFWLVVVRFVFFNYSLVVKEKLCHTSNRFFSSGRQLKSTSRFYTHYRVCIYNHEQKYINSEALTIILTIWLNTVIQSKNLLSDFANFYNLLWDLSVVAGSSSSSEVIYNTEEKCMRAAIHCDPLDIVGHVIYYFLDEYIADLVESLFTNTMLVPDVDLHLNPHNQEPIALTSLFIETPTTHTRGNVDPKGHFSRMTKHSDEADSRHPRFLFTQKHFQPTKK